MRKWYYFIPIISFLIVGFFNILSASIYSFTRNLSNPIYTGSSFQDWNEQGIMQPSALWLNNEFHLWYASYNGSDYKISHLQSNNGINWLSSNPVFSETNRSTHNPNLFYDSNGKYILTFTSSIEGNSDFKIKIITSSDGINFDQASLKTFLPVNSWEQGDMSAPFLWEENNLYYLLYAARNGSPWKLGLAYSNDLSNWTHCPNSFFDDAADGSLVKKNNQYILFYHKSDASGIVLRTSTDPLSCNMTWSQPQYVLTPGATYDQNHMIAPSVIEKDGILYMYYSGLSSQGKWTLNLATDQPIPVTTPTPTPSPTNEPTQTPSPTQIPKTYVIPGLFGSWNKQAILHRQSVPQSDWRLMPIFHEIEGLLMTLENIGLIPDNNLITFPYDWRQPIGTTVEQLHEVIESYKDSPEDTFQLIGHSLGGLIARIYAQKYPSDNLKKVITIGSPHDGTAQAYKAVAGGEVEYENTYFYLAQQTLLQLYKSSPLEQDKDTINSNLPVLNDLLPTYPYLRRTNQSFISPSQMIVKNNFLPPYNTTISDIFPNLYTNAGTNIKTLFGFQVNPPTQFDKLFNRYPDGRPSLNLYDSGDGVVLSNSALKGNNKILLNNHNHGDILAKKPAIKKILDALEISYNENDIVAGGQSPSSPALLFLMQSPATMKVTFNGNTYQEQEGMIYIPNAQSGNYLLNVTGVDFGNYTVTIGQIGLTNDYWMKIKGSINKSPASSQTESYPINFNANSPKPAQSDQQTLLKQIFILLNTILKTDPTQNMTVKPIESSLQLLFRSTNYQPPIIIRTSLLSLIDPLALQITKTNGQTRINYLEIINLHQRLFASTLGDNTKNLNNLNLQFRLTNQSLQQKASKLQSASSDKKNILMVANSMMNTAYQYETISPNYAFILLQTAQKILSLL